MVDYLDPDGNVTENWIYFDHTNIDDSVREPTIPTGVPIVDEVAAANFNDDNEIQEYHMETFDITGYKITAIKVWTYGFTTVAELTFNVDINFNGYQGNQTLNLPVLEENADWVSNNFVVDSAIQGHIDGLQVRYTSPNMPNKGDAGVIWAMYTEITTEGLGLPIEVNTVAWADIDEINTVPAEDIAEINTVS